MRYGNRSPWKRIITSPISCTVLLIVLFFLAKATWNIKEKAELSSLKLTQAQTELAKLKDRQTELSVKVARLSSEEGFEAEIRSKYPAIREGESVAVIIEEDSQLANASGASTTEDLNKKGWWRKLLAFFGL
jgi:cell division protein FtsB